MIELDAARALVRAELTQLAPAAVALDAAHGLVLAEEVVARDAVPPFANTAMDGYAVRAGDTLSASTEHPVRLEVVGELPAGTAPTRAVGSGEAIRIMTGAPMPDGADAIVMVERTQPDGDRGVLIEAAASRGDHVRPAAGDVSPGDVVFTPGTELGAAHLGVLASLGVTQVRVVPRARVGVLSTGDEIVASGALAPGQIRDSNRPMLLALAAEAGCTPINLGIVGDDEAKIFATIDSAVDECDALLTSGAVSVGDYDFVKVAIERVAGTRGGRYEWSQVAIKPAKPLAFASVQRGDVRVPIFGLPGNPVSSHVSFELFARPVLRSMMGHRAPDRPVVSATADQALARRRDGKLNLDRVQVWTDASGALRCARSGFQASNVLSGMARANGLALLADGTGVAAGDPVQVMLLAPPLPGTPGSFFTGG
ncbi:MAG TPA: gephyrin-like molybdotransferase Glp [Acidimicrobiia bacterium]